MNEFYRETAIPSDIVYTGKLFYALGIASARSISPPFLKAIGHPQRRIAGQSSLKPGTSGFLGPEFVGTTFYSIKHLFNSFVIHSMQRYVGILLIRLLLSTVLKAQDTLPRFSATARGPGKILISWHNNYPVVTQISIQRSTDSLRILQHSAHRSGSHPPRKWRRRQQSPAPQLLLPALHRLR